MNRGQNAPNPFGTLGGLISGWAWFHICSGEEYCDLLWPTDLCRSVQIYWPWHVTFEHLDVESLGVNDSACHSLGLVGISNVFPIHPSHGVPKGNPASITSCHESGVHLVIILVQCASERSDHRHSLDADFFLSLRICLFLYKNTWNSTYLYVSSNLSGHIPEILNFEISTTSNWDFPRHMHCHIPNRVSPLSWRHKTTLF